MKVYCVPINGHADEFLNCVRIGILPQYAMHNGAKDGFSTQRQELSQRSELNSAF